MVSSEAAPTFESASSDAAVASLDNGTVEALAGAFDPPVVYVLFFVVEKQLSLLFLQLRYGTAQFKLEARVRVTRVCFIAPLEYFSKSCVSVDNCTGISRAIHAPVTSLYMLAYVCMCMQAHLR